jgi:hypothetical protein
MLQSSEARFSPSSAAIASAPTAWLQGRIAEKKSFSKKKPAEFAFPIG